MPYRVEPQAGNRGRIYVYDPNYVDSVSNDHFIEVDLNTNSWRYQLLAPIDLNPEIAWAGNTLNITPFSVYIEEPKLPTEGTDGLAVDGLNYKSNFGTDNESLKHANNNIEADNGTHTGCVLSSGGGNLQFVQEISRTQKLTPLKGLNPPSSFPNAYFMPADQAWTFNGLGSVTGSKGGSLLMFGPHALLGAIGPAQASTHDRLHVAETFHTLSFSTTDLPKPMSLFQMHETEAWTRIFGLANMSIGRNEVATMIVSPDAESLEIINTSPLSKAVDLNLTVVGRNIVGLRRMPVIIEGNARTIFHPIWDQLEDGPILMEIDAGNNGTIDRVQLLGGQTFPMVTASANVPTTRGQFFTIIEQGNAIQGAPIYGNIGWINLDFPLPPGQSPTQHMHGNNTTLVRWLATQKGPMLWNKGNIPAISGTHGGLFNTVQNEHMGQIVLIPTYDKIFNPNGAVPVYYRINGFAVVKIIPSSDTKVIRAELLLKR